MQLSVKILVSIAELRGGGVTKTTAALSFGSVRATSRSRDYCHPHLRERKWSPETSGECRQPVPGRLGFGCGQSRGSSHILRGNSGGEPGHCPLHLTAPLPTRGRRPLSSPPLIPWTSRTLSLAGLLPLKFNPPWRAPPAPRASERRAVYFLLGEGPQHSAPVCRLQTPPPPATPNFCLKQPSVPG